MEKAKKKVTFGKIVKIILLVILALVVVAAAAVYITWHNEIKTVMSIEQLAAKDEAHKDCATYTFKVHGGYYFEDFLKQGGSPSVDGTISYLVKNITKGLFDLSLSDPAAGCTCFTAKTSDGDRIMGRNYDFRPTNTAIVFTDAKGDKHATVSSVDLQFISVKPESDLSPILNKVLCLAAPYVPMDGMNDAGVSCGILMSYQEGSTQQNTDRPDLIASAMVRLVLDYADDLDEAIELIKQYDMHDTLGTSFHYFIADASGRSATLEYLCGEDCTKDTDDPDNRQLVITYSDGDKSNVVTNFIINPGYYSDDADKHGLDRYELVKKQLEESDSTVKDVQEGMDILNSVSRRDFAQSDSNGITVHSVVYNLTDRTVMWVGNEHYGEEAYTYTYDLSA